MHYVRVKLRNLEGSSLLMHPMLDEEKKVMRTKIGAPKIRDMSLEKEAAERIYRDNQGRIGFPRKWIYGCLVNAGTKVPFRGRTNVTNSKGGTQLYSFLWVLDTFCVLTNIQKGIQNGKKEKDYWEVSFERCPQSQNKGGKGGSVAVVRPEFPEWEAEFTIKYNEKRVHEDVVKKLLEEGGLNEGFGSGRPNRGLNHGQFEVVEFADITNEMEKKAKKTKNVA